MESKKGQECIFKTETYSKINVWLTKGRGREGGQIRETGLTDTDYYISNKEQGPTVRNREVYSIT